MTTNSAFEMERPSFADAPAMGSAAPEISSLGADLLGDYRKYFPAPPATQDMHLDDLFLCVAKVGSDNSEISKADFKDKLGDQAAEFLNKIGCEKISINGDQVKLTLDEAKTMPINDNGIKDVKLASEIDLKVAKNGDEISVTDVKGIRINPKWLPEFDLPDFKITPKGIDLGSLVPYIPAPGAYEQLDELVQKLGK